MKSCCILVSFLTLNALVAGATVSSPNGDITATVDIAQIDGLRDCLTWRVTYKEKPFVIESPLTFEVKDLPALGIGCRIAGVTRSDHDETWRPVYGERSEIRDHYNDMQLDIRDAHNRRFQLTVRAYNEGAALQYTFPNQPALKTFTIAAEHTQFRFAANHTAWAVYSAQGVYSRVTLNDIKPNCERPLTIEIADGPAVAIAEAALVDYARMRLKPVAGVPFAVESMLGSEVQVRTPYNTPWRVIMIAADVCRLLEQNDIILNLNAPCAIADTSWIKPGKVIREVTLTTAGGKACVDFAVDRGLQYVEYDAGWYGHEYDSASDATTVTVDPKRSPGPLDLHEVIRYADERNIGIIVYVNQRALQRQLDEILPLYRSWGIKGVKYGFVHVGDQKWTTWLHEAIRKAADNRLMLDIHDEYRPTGYSRTYPNLMTVEGIRGNEEMPTAEENLILPFTRYLCGPGDYTICWYNGRVKNTAAHQLAAAVVCYSPWQFLFWYDRPQMYKGEPELDFFKHVPTVWDDTKVLQGRIGEYVTIARRSGDEWFVGTMNAVKQRRLEIPLTFLTPGKEYAAQIYSDANPAGGSRMAVTITQFSVDSTKTLAADMAPNGGQVIHITPARN